jgi:hypothetical protein
MPKKKSKKSKKGPAPLGPAVSETAALQEFRAKRCCVVVQRDFTTIPALDGVDGAVGVEQLQFSRKVDAVKMVGGLYSS